MFSVEDLKLEGLLHAKPLNMVFYLVNESPSAFIAVEKSHSEDTLPWITAFTTHLM